MRNDDGADGHDVASVRLHIGAFSGGVEHGMARPGLHGCLFIIDSVQPGQYHMCWGAEPGR